MTTLSELECALRVPQWWSDYYQLVTWFCKDGETLLQKYATPADSVQGIRLQQSRLAQDGEVVQVYVEKAERLVHEGEAVTGCHEPGQVTGMGRGGKELMDRVKKYKQRLQVVTERVNNHAECLELLDRCYEWAMHASQLAGSVGATPTLVSVEEAEQRIEAYLEQNPPLSDDVFARATEQAEVLESTRLRERCGTARLRCQEAATLLQHRQVMLARTKQQLRTRATLSPSSQSTMSICEPVNFRENYYKRATPHSMLSELRRRSYAGKPSGPIYSPSAAAFKETILGMDIEEYEEQLFNEGLITEDMSDRIVTSLPKGLSDSTLRGSRESLRNSEESLNTDKEPAGWQQAVGGSLVNVARLGRPLRKMKRIGSCTLPERAEEGAYERPVSLLTAAQSVDSLPTLPEDEALDVGAQSERRTEWAPLAPQQTVSQSMTDLRAAEEDVTRRRQLQLVMQELVKTERDYVRHLRYVRDNYMSELSRDAVPQPLRGKRNVIFGNLEKIHDFHSTQFLSELEASSGRPLSIGQCFLHHAASFYLYALYNKNKPRSDTLMREHGSNFFSQRQQQLDDALDLSSYLLKPVQRIGKYALLLKQVLKLCPPSEQEYPILKEALDMVKFQLRHGNDLLALDCLTGSDVNLHEQGMLLRQDTFLVYHGRHKAIRQIFLFEKLLVLSKSKRNSAGKEVYSYKNSLKTSDLGLTENVGDSQFKFEIWFRKLTGSDTYTLQAQSTEIRHEWVREISRLLWKQAIKNRERRLAEAAQMGSGGKPCIDLKPSKDNIHDRFVNISLSKRIPKARSSVAVGSVDYQRGPMGKRPHSLISLSSTGTSSSNSSGLQPSALCISFESPLENARHSTASVSSNTEDAATQTAAAASADARPLSLLEVDPYDLLPMSDV